MSGVQNLIVYLFFYILAVVSIQTTHGINMPNSYFASEIIS